MTPFRRSLATLNELQRRGSSWSGYERNCFFLNTGTGRFANISATSGFDFLDDARAVALVDWNADGAQDIWVTNRTGPRVRVLQNEPHPQHRWIQCRLEGTTCNRDAIGARLEVRANGQKPLISTLRAGAGYLSQSTKRMHVGLGSHEGTVDVIVRWPGGESSTYNGLQTNKVYHLKQGINRAIELGSSDLVLADNGSSQLDATKSGNGDVATANRTFLPLSVPLPQLKYLSHEGEQHAVNVPPKPTVLTLWSLQCLPCLSELSSWAESRDVLSAKLEIVALNVDGLNASDSEASLAARQWLETKRFPYRSGDASTDLMRRLELAQLHLFDTQQALPLPLSLLFDQHGALVAWYRGPVAPSQILADCDLLSASAADKLRHSVPFPGQWRAVVSRTNVAAVARMFRQAGNPSDELEIYACALRGTPDDSDLHLAIADVLVQNNRRDEAQEHLQRVTELRLDSSAAWTRLGKLSLVSAPDKAIEYFQRGLSIDPRDADAHLQMGRLLLASGQTQQAKTHLEHASELRPTDLPSVLNLAIACEKLGEYARARELLERAIEIDPRSVYPRNNLAWLLATSPNEQVRDARQALEIAESIAETTNYAEAYILDTLAAALASNRQFDRAVEMLEKSQRLNPQADTESVSRRLDKYRAGKMDWEAD